TARDALQHALFVAATLSQYENVMPDLGPRIQRLFVGTAAAWSAFHLQRIDRPNDLGFKFPQGLRPASLLEAVSGRTSCGRIQGRSSAEIAHKLAVHVRDLVTDLCYGRLIRRGDSATIPAFAYPRVHGWFRQHWTVGVQEADVLLKDLDEEQIRAINRGLQ